MDDYELLYIKRLNKIGGGMALYVHKAIKYSVLNNISFVLDNVMYKNRNQ